MMNVEKHVAYWQRQAEEEMAVATVIAEKEWYRQALFFAHLALE